MEEPSPAGPPETDLTTLPEPLDAEQLRELRRRARASLDAQRRHATELEQQLTGEIGRISDELAEAFAQESEEAASQARAELAEERRQFVAEREEWEQLRDEIEASLETLRENLQEKALAQQTQRQELEKTEAALAHQKQELTRWAAELADEREKVEALRREKRSEQGGADGDAAWQAERERLIAERDSFADAADEAVSRLDQSQHDLALALDAGKAALELQEKFSLALEDGRQQRMRIAELEQELQARPAAGADESAELAKLRAERDDMIRTIDELRSRPAGDDSDQAELDELRARFELAVEDVRTLKTQNAELEERLAAGGGSAPAEAGDGLDWESQKRRMLASLEGGDASEAATEERATIEGTIRITDEVIAAKEQRIAELESALAASADGDAPVVLESAPHEDDERLEAERARLRQLEQQWEEKLRGAELELSVERAKIAREQAELAELRIDLESKQRSITGTPSGPKEDEQPQQRKWFNKLGLGGEEG